MADGTSGGAVKVADRWRYHRKLVLTKLSERRGPIRLPRTGNENEAIRIFKHAS